MLNVENSSENAFLRTFLPKLIGIYSFEQKLIEGKFLKHMACIRK